MKCVLLNNDAPRTSNERISYNDAIDARSLRSISLVRRQLSHTPAASRAPKKRCSGSKTTAPTTSGGSTTLQSRDE